MSVSLFDPQITLWTFGFRSQSGDKDEDAVEKRLEEAKARLPLRFGKEAERLRHYGDVKEWGTENEKEAADEEMSKHFEQNEDKKLEGGSASLEVIFGLSNT